MQPRKSSSRGFTLAEMMLSLALGVVVVGVAVEMFSHAMSGTFSVSQQAEMQQDLRAAENMMVKDISMAGAGGFNSGGVPLVSGSGVTAPLYGCSSIGCGPNNKTGLTFPTNSAVNYLYAITPGYRKGATLNSTKGATDVITVTYVDTTLALNQYLMTFPNAAPTTALFTMPVPTPIPAPIPVSDSGTGLQLGDFVLISSSVGGSTAYAVAEVSTVSGVASPYTVQFNTPSNSKLNQLGGAYGLTALVGGTNMTARRIWVITYYIDVKTDGTPVLMRQVNARIPIAVSENISDLRFLYDTYDDTKNPPTQINTIDANLSTGGSPNLIRKITIQHLTLRSPLAHSDGYQAMDVQTSISARNLGYSDRYPVQ
ncbi:MAG TPA: prepilin-type N-terminal cleavage/methylation domain-containing protein [Terriglobales bacterium]|jgi:prepilin-type N-terminal cleavage/methylation domain-containing protein|nr:prepilin-type N-terminal cleavage/methylation domain-containing protein [Terriglobales bacterium]